MFLIDVTTKSNDVVILSAKGAQKLRLRFLVSFHLFVRKEQICIIKSQNLYHVKKNLFSRETNGKREGHYGENEREEEEEEPDRDWKRRRVFHESESIFFGFWLWWWVVGGGCGILVVLLSIDGGCLLYSQRKRKERVFVTCESL